MVEVPKFALYGEGDPETEQEIQPALALRSWGDLSEAEKQIALQYLENNGWIARLQTQCFVTIEYLNHRYLRRCPGERLHAMKPAPKQYGGNNEFDRIEAAV